MSLQKQARSRTRIFLLFDSFLSIMGFAVVFPLVSINFIDHLGWSGALVGFALGARQLCQQGMGIFGGALADRFGAKWQIVYGMFIRAGGFALIAVANTPFLLIVACIISGLAGALFDPPRTALLIKMTRLRERGKFFSILMMIDTAGWVIGALLGSWLLSYEFKLVGWFGCGIFILIGILNILILPAFRVSLTPISFKESIKYVWADQRFVRFVFSLTGYFMIGVQVMLMLPILVKNIAGTEQAVKYMYALESALAISLLYMIARWSEKRFSLYQRLQAGFLLTIVMLFPLGFIENFTVLMFVIGFFFLGSVISEPARETLIASLIDPKARASYSGFSRLGLALGGAVCYTGGGWLYDLGVKFDLPFMPWFILAFIGLLTAWAFHKQLSGLVLKTE